MRLNQHVGLVLALLVVCVTPLAAQNGSIHGQVLDSVTQQALPGATVQLVFRAAGLSVQPGRQIVTDIEGRFTLSEIAPGTVTVKVTRIGYGPQQQDISVTGGGTAEARFTLAPQASILEPVVVTGYGSQRREAITGSVSTVDAAAANVGVKTNADQLLQGRAAGVNILQNNGEPGAGAQVLIRGGSSLSATNEPLYVIDGVPINNVATEPRDIGAVGDPALPRNPLNLINPGDIASITVLKDASATAIYGSRASNGVILIETKKGNASSGPTFEYDGYVSTSSPARRLDVLNGAEYRAFVTNQVGAYQADSTGFCGRHATTVGCGGTDTTLKFSDSAAVFSGLSSSHLTSLGSANTDWAAAITRTAVTNNHNLSFSGGTEATRYRASVNYANQQGVTLASALERIQGRLSATHSDLGNRLRMDVDVTTSRVNNTYLTYENNGGFTGGVFENVATFNPTQPITFTDSTGTHFYEVGGTTVRNPVAMAKQIQNIGQTTRTLANASAAFDLIPGLTAKVTLGLDHSGGQRQEYYPLSNPVGQAVGGGLARQADLQNQTQTLQTVLNYQRPIGSVSLDWVGGYEYSKFTTNFVTAQGVGFFTDAFGFNSLNAAKTRTDSSDATDARLVSFFSRANLGFNDRFYVTGVLRYDGSSRFATGHQWAAFPGLSASWHLSREGFMQSSPFSDLKVRVGWGLQGNPSVDPYTSLITLAGNTGATYPWGDQAHIGVVPNSNGNPNLKWEQTSQVDAAVDFGILNSRLSGTVEYYHKNTKDLLLTIDVPQPAFNSTQLKNVGRLSGHGLEITLDALAISRPTLTWRAGLVLAAERSTVVNLGDQSFISTGFVSGQGQSNQVSERLIPGQPVGTFYGPVFTGVDSVGRQVFQCSAATPGCTNGRTTLGFGPSQDDYRIIGNANPDFTLGLHSELNWNRFDLSFLIRAAVGQDVFNNTALVYSSKSNALGGGNFLRPALSDPTGLHEPSIYSSRWVENASFVRLQNITVGYDLNLPMLTRSARSARLYVSADNLILLTGYSGLDPEVFTSNGLATRGLDYLTYPRPRTITGGLRLLF
ncbi:MAG: SusC/RagA family TonB-linked outer membrane protein [Gemmatimonadales bacterium]